jgi:hypothetical protein
MNYRSVFLATTILIGEKSSTSCLIARHLDEKSHDCKQRIEAFRKIFTNTSIFWESYLKNFITSCAWIDQSYCICTNSNWQMTWKHLLTALPKNLNVLTIAVILLLLLLLFILCLNMKKKTGGKSNNFTVLLRYHVNKNSRDIWHWSKQCHC